MMMQVDRHAFLELNEQGSLFKYIPKSLLTRRLIRRERYTLSGTNECARYSNAAPECMKNIRKIG